MRKALLIAYHFPPFAQSSGIQRTLRFAQYLPEFGWEPVVLTVKPSAYPHINSASESLIPPDCRVIRLPCLDAARHTAWRGRYPRAFALPDRWASWAWFARWRAARLCREEEIDVLWSTYPIATAHAIGATMARRTGLPWIADFRDPMVQPDYPADPRQRAAFAGVEASVAANASGLVFTTPSALDTYRRRFADLPAERFHLLENGFDESTFAGAKSLPENGSDGTAESRPLVILHSGIVYPYERDPAQLFKALGELKRDGRVRPGDVLFRFRAAAHEGLLRSLAADEDVEDLVEIAPSIPYPEAIAEMLSADGLLVLQANNCNEQIPAKLYEYLRAGKPI
ncbi:MAG: glycosyltransferase family 4 protein, partial [Burkholderiaceae bacterium]|nr:glycosyltransferase family 4 protein [Burkholderiaceae bacterium]